MCVYVGSKRDMKEGTSVQNHGLEMLPRVKRWTDVLDQIQLRTHKSERRQEKRIERGKTQEMHRLNKNMLLSHIANPFTSLVS